MANEVSTLNIGNVEYPIYSEGVLLDGTSSDNEYFITSSNVSGNTKLRPAVSITKNSDSLNIYHNNKIIIGGEYLYLKNGDDIAFAEIETDNLGDSKALMLRSVYALTSETEQSQLSLDGQRFEVRCTNDVDAGNRYSTIRAYGQSVYLGISNDNWCSASIEMLQEDNLYENMSNAIMISSDAASLDSSPSNSYIYVNGPEIKLDCTYDMSDSNNYHSTIDITDKYIQLNQVYTDSDDYAMNSKINLTNGKVTIDATNEVHIGDHDPVDVEGSQRGYISIGSNSSLIQVGSGAQVIWFGACDAFGVNAKYNLNLQRNNSDLGNCALNIGSYSRIIGVGLSESTQGICMTTGERSNGNWNSVDIYGDTFSIRQVHNCNTPDEYENSIIMDQNGISLQGHQPGGSLTGYIAFDAPSNIVHIYGEETIEINGPKINIGATIGELGDASNIVIGETFRTGRTSYCEILNPNIYLCKASEGTDASAASAGFVFAGGQSTGVFRPYRSSSYSSTPVNLGGSSTEYRWTNIYSVNAVSTSSDERLKNIVDNIDVNLDDLVELRKFKYTWKNIDDGRVYVGMSAQEVQKLYPDIVETGEDGYLSMSYERLSVIALAAIDKLHAENKQLKDRLTRLENIVNDKLSSL